MENERNVGKPRVEVLYGTDSSPPERQPDEINQQPHPWDVDHFLIERVEGGWRQKDGVNLQTSMLPYFRELKQDGTRGHPVLYQLYGRYFYNSGNADLRQYHRDLSVKFAKGEVVTDEELAALPPPPRWPQRITKRWPELRRTYPRERDR